MYVAGDIRNTNYYMYAQVIFVDLLKVSLIELVKLKIMNIVLVIVIFLHL